MLKLDKNIVVNEIEPPKFDWKKTYFPKPGMLGTEYVGSDRYAVICISVDSPKRITIAPVHELDEDNVKDNPKITIDDEGVWWGKFNINKEDYEKWSLRTDKRGNQGWREMGSGKHSASIHWGIADPYRDPSF